MNLCLSLFVDFSPSFPVFLPLFSFLPLLVSLYLSLSSLYSLLSLYSVFISLSFSPRFSVTLFSLHSSRGLSSHPCVSFLPVLPYLSDSTFPAVPNRRFELPSRPPARGPLLPDPYSTPGARPALWFRARHHRPSPEARPDAATGPIKK